MNMIKIRRRFVVKHKRIRFECDRSQAHLFKCDRSQTHL